MVLSYEILDESGALKNTKSTTVAVETLSSFSEEIKIPETLDEGVYILKEVSFHLMVYIKQNPVFEKEIMDAGIKANILRTKDLRQRIIKGLAELKEENWTSENECRTFSEFLKKT